MWEKSIKKLLLQFKILEFRVKTWKNAREISKAYDQTVLIKPVKSFNFKKLTWQFSRLVLLISTVFAIGIFMIYGVSKLIEYHISVNPEAAVLNLEIPPLTKPQLIQNDSENIYLQVDESSDSLNRSFNKRDKPDTLVMAASPFDFIIVANKAYKQMYLLEKQAREWKIIRSYKMAIGAREGQKRREGDKRTPEGTYFIVGRKEGYELSSIYGPLAYILNYPNEEDIREERTGSGIWIHGTEKDSVPIQTKGCLEIPNDKLLELSSFLKRGIGTPVIIVDSPEEPNPLAIPDYSTLEKKSCEFLKKESIKTELFSTILSEWKTAWESKDINIYRNFYDTSRFKGQGLSWNSWEERKIQTFKLYQVINIDVDSIFISDFTSNYAVVKFLQEFKTNKNRIEDGKVLHLINDNNSWKIIQENTCPKEEILL